MLARGVGREIKTKGDPTYPFLKIVDTLRAVDLVFGNLECPVSDVGRDQHHLYSFRADPGVVDGLKFAGFRVMGLANNHADDWGHAALLDTIQRLHAADILAVGAGANDLEAHQPTLVDLNGVKIAFLAYVGIAPKSATAGPESPGVSWLDPNRAISDIRAARPLADVLIVVLHWGVEYSKRPEKGQVALAKRMVDAGADLIVGAHPHVVQPVENYNGHWIAYSLGNFVFDQKTDPSRHGIMLKVTLTGKQISDVTPVPITIDSTFQPSTDPASETGRSPSKAVGVTRSSRNY